MSCYKFSAIDINRRQIQYPLTRSKMGSSLISDTPVEIFYTVADIVESDTLTLTFDEPFASVPTVVAGYVSLVSYSGNTSVYVESVTRNGCTLKTGAPVTGKIAVHAINLG